jgi:proline iminopeptidase
MHISINKDFYVDVPDARLHVIIEGAQDDPVVLIHGGPGVPDYLEKVAEILSSKHQVIRYDQRGTGGSLCLSGRFGLEEHIEDLEVIRQTFGYDKLNLFGHSWGGTLAQLYTEHFPKRVKKLFLCNSAIGLGDDWKAMEREVMAHNRRRGGFWGFILLGFWQLVAVMPIPNKGAQRMNALVWKNYFNPPSSAPPVDKAWLSGINSIRPMLEARKTAMAADAARLNNMNLDPDTRVQVLFGDDDIYGPTIERLFSRFPEAKHMILEKSGHLPWLQNPRRFREEICMFFGC